MDEKPDTAKPSADTKPRTRRNGGRGSKPAATEPASGAPKSKPSDAPSAYSISRYRAPSNAMQFAAQASDVATRVLNGTMDLETARVYGAVARTVAQAMTTEVQRARFLQQQPDLELPLDTLYEEPEEPQP